MRPNAHTDTHTCTCQKSYQRKHRKAITARKSVRADKPRLECKLHHRKQRRWLYDYRYRQIITIIAIRCSSKFANFNGKPHVIEAVADFVARFLKTSIRFNNDYLQNAKLLIGREKNNSRIRKTNWKCWCLDVVMVTPSIENGNNEHAFHWQSAKNKPFDRMHVWVRLCPIVQIQRCEYVFECPQRTLTQTYRTVCIQMEQIPFNSVQIFKLQMAPIRHITFYFVFNWQFKCQTHMQFEFTFHPNFDSIEKEKNRQKYKEECMETRNDGEWILPWKMVELPKYCGVFVWFVGGRVSVKLWCFARAIRDIWVF